MPTDVNLRVWEHGDHLKEYANRELRPVEVFLLLRYRDALQGRVLELGCGAGRLTAYLVAIAREVEGIDLSPGMIAYCRRTLPQATFHERDFRDLSIYGAGSLDAAVAPCNVLDVLGDAGRRMTLEDIGRVLADDGLLIMSSHNRAFVPKLRSPTRLSREDGPRELVRSVVRMGRRVRNRRELLPQEHDEPTYAIVNDAAHDYSLLHYYISRDCQERQLAEHGFELIECLDLDGQRVAAGETAADHAELHYVARRSAQA